MTDAEIQALPIDFDDLLEIYEDLEFNNDGNYTLQDVIDALRAYHEIEVKK